MFPGSNGSGTEDITCTEFGEFSNVKETLGFGKGSDISFSSSRGNGDPGKLSRGAGSTEGADGYRYDRDRSRAVFHSGVTSSWRP